MVKEQRIHNIHIFKKKPISLSQEEDTLYFLKRVFNTPEANNLLVASGLAKGQGKEP